MKTKKATILLVENETMASGVIRCILKTAGYPVLRVSSAHNALAVAREYPRPMNPALRIAFLTRRHMILFPTRPIAGTSHGRTFMDRNLKQLYWLTGLQFTKLAEQRSHDKQTQQAFEKFTAVASQGGRPRVFLCGFSEFSILDETAPADSEMLKSYGKAAVRYRL